MNSRRKGVRAASPQPLPLAAWPNRPTQEAGTRTTAVKAFDTRAASMPERSAAVAFCRNVSVEQGNVCSLEGMPTAVVASDSAIAAAAWSSSNASTNTCTSRAGEDRGRSELMRRCMARIAAAMAGAACTCVLAMRATCGMLDLLLSWRPEAVQGSKGTVEGKVSSAPATASAASPPAGPTTALNGGVPVSRRSAELTAVAICCAELPTGMVTVDTASDVYGSRAGSALIAAVAAASASAVMSPLPPSTTASRRRVGGTRWGPKWMGVEESLNHLTARSSKVSPPFQRAPLSFVTSTVMGPGGSSGVTQERWVRFKTLAGTTTSPAKRHPSPRLGSESVRI